MVAPTQLNDIHQRSDLSLSLYDLYKNKECCDVTVCTTDPQSCDQIYSIECHKVVLVAACQYFRDALLVGEDSSNLNMVDIGKGKIGVIKEVLSFLYTGKCQASSANIVELLRYSLDWKLKNLERLITGLIANYLTVENVVEMYELAVQEGKEGLEKESSMFLRRNFADVISSEQFKELSITSLCTILKEDEIKIDSEDSIMRTVLIWLECNTEVTSGVNNLWSVIRFENLTAKYLVKELLDHPQLQAEPQRDLVKEAVTSLYEYGQAFTCGSLNIPRYWGVKPVNDKLAKITYEKKICVYDDEKKEWEQVGEVPDWVDDSTYYCITGSTVVLSGGREKGAEGKCTAVDLKRKVMTLTLPDCDNELEYRSVALVKNMIYSIGGRSINSNKIVSDKVTRLKLSWPMNKWEVMESLPKGVYSPIILTHKKFIFVIGGLDHDNQCSSFNQVYDLDQGKWSLCTAAPQNCTSIHNGGFVQNSQIHIFTFEHHMTYTLDTDIWSCVESKISDCYSHPVLHDDQILACVTGHSFPLDFYHVVCKTYDEESNQWHDNDININDCMNFNSLFTVMI